MQQEHVTYTIALSYIWNTTANTGIPISDFHNPKTRWSQHSTPRYTIDLIISRLSRTMLLECYLVPLAAREYDGPYYSTLPELTHSPTLLATDSLLSISLTVSPTHVLYNMILHWAFPQSIRYCGLFGGDTVAILKKSHSSDVITSRTVWACLLSPVSHSIILRDKSTTIKALSRPTYKGSWNVI